ncbi:MAG: amino acid ABC transporter permease [Tabrizicola sp.]|jgi:His/Glu/Gln/Arg/opine family amino acid ABC transporter permease subunit|uniref:amino acid ABC transporter permease n=1 Tax=Tabrizicola sp. TaxID=2005166 RepID=UPI003BAFEF76|nr:amino acid ABC transporter permease [Tabrizicola sp.]
MFNYTFHWHQAFQALPQMLWGALITIEVAVISMIFGIIFAVLIALCRLSHNRVAYGVATAWVEMARNTPALFQIYMAHFGLGAFGIHLSPWWALLAGITFNNAGYMAETFRGALRAIPATQTRAALSLGMGPLRAFWSVVMPQMFRISFPPMTNQMVWAVLMTSLGLTVGLASDLAGVTQELNVRTFRTFEFFAMAAVLYYLIAKAVMLGARLVAWRLFRY